MKSAIIANILASLVRIKSSQPFDSRDIRAHIELDHNIYTVSKSKNVTILDIIRIASNINALWFME